MITVLFLGIFVARFSFACLDYKVKAKFAMTADNEEDSNQSSEEKTECKKSVSEYEYSTYGSEYQYANCHFIAGLYYAPHTQTQSWHLSVPTPPPNCPS